MVEFINFYKSEIDPSTDIFLIDPNKNNPRAIRVYEKAGFVCIGEYMLKDGTFIGQTSLVMVKRV